MLAAIGNSQHQYRQVIEDRQKFVPVQPMGQAFAHGFGLGSMVLGQVEVAQQAEQGVFDMLGDGTVGWLWRVGQGVQHLAIHRVRVNLRQLILQHRRQRQAADRRRLRRLWQGLGRRNHCKRRFRRRGENDFGGLARLQCFQDRGRHLNGQ